MDQNDQQIMSPGMAAQKKKRKTSRWAIITLVLLSPFILITVVDIVFPAIGRIRELTYLSYCRKQLVDIGRYLQLYQMDYDGALPPELPTLITTLGLEPDMLICPGSNMAAPVTGSPNELAGKDPLWPLDKDGDKWVYFPSGISYVYRGGDLTEADPALVILAYDLPDNHYDGGRNVLFLDTDVKKMNEESFQATLAKDNQWRREQGRPEIPADP